MDVVGLVLSCTDLVQRLYAYGSAVHGAQGDIRKLTTELLGVTSVLNDISTRLPTVSTTATYANLETSARQVLTDLFNILDVKDGKKAHAWAALRWPSRKDDAEKLAVRLRSLKQDLSLCIETENTAMTAAIKTDLHDLSSKYTADAHAAKSAADEATLDHLRDSLAGSINQRRRQLDLVRMRHPDTGHWMHENAAFANWLSNSEGQTQPLALIGKSGAGKTSLLASAAQVAADKGAVTAVCFVAYNEPTSSSVLAVFNVLAAQLSTACPSILLGMQRKGVSNGEVSLAEIQDRILEGVKALARPVHLFVDAVNESRVDDDLLSALYSFMSKSPLIRLLYSSTTLPSQFSRTTITIPLSGLPSDISLFIERALSTTSTLARLRPALLTEIRTTLSTKADSSFRYAQLTLAHLAAQPTGAQVRAALATLPADMNASYAALLSRIPENARDLAREALLWLCVARKPLSLAALCEAAAFEPGDRHIDEDALAFPEDLSRWLGGMISLAPDSRSWEGGGYTLAHSSVRTFLTSHVIKSFPADVSFFALDMTEAERRVFRKFLTYLRMVPFSHGITQHQNYRRLYSQKPLTYHAAVFWATHAASIESSLTYDDVDAILEFLDTKNEENRGSFGAWVQLLNRFSPLSIAHETSPIYYMASYGLKTILTTLLQRPDGQDEMEKPGGRYAARPVVACVFRRKWEIARVLVDAGAAPPATCIVQEEGCVHVGEEADHLAHVANESSQDGEDLRAKYGRADLRAHVTALRSLDKEAIARGDACLRKVNKYRCGCIVSVRPVVHVEACGTFAVEDIVTDVGVGCPRCDAEA